MAAVEGGGTSFRVAVCEYQPSTGRLPQVIHQMEVDSSKDPLKTITDCVEFFTKHKPHGGFHSLGIATFGPVGVSLQRPQEYGRILCSSPKASWRNIDILTPLRQACEGKHRELKVLVETDVNAPALAEYRETKGISSLAYITVGTGIGVGLVVNHKPVHGFMHPEGGHVPIQPLLNDSFGGYSWGKDTCPFFGRNTVEGIASSVALTERLELLQGKGNQERSILETLPDDHEVWDHAANALANVCATLFLMLSMEKIVIGGGIMNRPGLLEKVQSRTIYLLNNYLALPRDIPYMITKSRHGSNAGLVGAIVLAQRAWEGDDVKARERERGVKSEAYSFGLRHGMILGALAAALVAKYSFYRSKK